jgi:hypothetical protein
MDNGVFYPTTYWVEDSSDLGTNFVVVLEKSKPMLCGFLFFGKYIGLRHD